jgi:hypothetical protein
MTAQVQTNTMFQVMRVHTGQSAVKTRDQGDMAQKGGEGISANMGKVESFSLHLLTLVLLAIRGAVGLLRCENWSALQVFDYLSLNGADMRSPRLQK